MYCVIWFYANYFSKSAQKSHSGRNWTHSAHIRMEIKKDTRVFIDHHWFTVSHRIGNTNKWSLIGSPGGRIGNFRMITIERTEKEIIEHLQMRNADDILEHTVKVNPLDRKVNRLRRKARDRVQQNIMLGKLLVTRATRPPQPERLRALLQQGSRSMAGVRA